MFDLMCHVADRELQLSAAAQHGKGMIEICVRPHISSPEKDQNAKYEVWFLLNVCDFHTIT